MRKRALLMACATTLVIAGGMVSAWAEGTLRFDVKPLIKNGTTLVQMRPLFEYLGAKVAWHAATKRIEAKKGKTRIRLTLGNKQATVNGKTKMLTVPPQVVKGHTMVPLRFVSEALNTDVEYHGSFITLCTPDGTCTKVDLQ